MLSFIALPNVDDHSIKNRFWLFAPRTSELLLNFPFFFSLDLSYWSDSTLWFFYVTFSLAVSWTYAGNFWKASDFDIVVFCGTMFWHTAFVKLLVQICCSFTFQFLRYARYVLLDMDIVFCRSFRKEI